MAFHLHLIDLLWHVVPTASPLLPDDIGRATSAERRLSLQSYLGEGGCLHSRWTHARD